MRVVALAVRCSVSLAHACLLFVGVVAVWCVCPQLERPREYRVRFRFPEALELTPPVLGVHDVEFGYGDGPSIFKKVNFGIDTDSRVAIVGPNGVGKSTLLNLMVGLLDAREGEIRRNHALRVGRYNQHFVDVLPMDKSPVDFLRATDPDGALTTQDARRLLGRFGLGGHAHLIKIRKCSGGQKARVLFASLTLTKPHLLILDEPTNHLDLESVRVLPCACCRVRVALVVVVGAFADTASCGRRSMPWRRGSASTTAAWCWSATTRASSARPTASCGCAPTRTSRSSRASSTTTATSCWLSCAVLRPRRTSVLASVQRSAPPPRPRLWQRRRSAFASGWPLAKPARKLRVRQLARTPLPLLREGMLRLLLPLRLRLRSKCAP